MRKLFIGSLVAFMSCGLYAQDKTETFVIGRVAVGDASYHYAEVFQSRGRWIYPDIGYIDFNNAGKYRETFIGVGATLYKSKRILLIEEGYFDQASGPSAQSAMYFQPWTYVRFQISSKVSNETVYFPYVPLNKAGRVQQVIERSKTEYDFKHWKVGAGYSGYQFASNEWQHKPFVTTTLKTKAGNFETWFQRVPGNHFQVQFRYAKVF